MILLQAFHEFLYINIPLVSFFQVYHFVVQSEIKEKLRFMKIQPKVVICNDYESSLTVKAVEIGGTEKVCTLAYFFKTLPGKAIGKLSMSV